MFLDAPPTEKGETFLEGVRRVEFRTDETVEEEFREEVERRDQRVGTLNEHERRITSLIVFVDEGGSERRLIEE